MIDWIIAFFYFLENFGIFVFKDMIFTNLIFLLICRGFLGITFILNYRIQEKETRTENKFSFLRKDRLFFGFKQSLIIFVGMLYFPVAIFFSILGLLKSGQYLIEIGNNKDSKNFKISGRLMFTLLPTLFLIWYTIQSEIFTLLAISLSLVIFFNFEIKKAKKSLSEFLETIKARRFYQFNKYSQAIIIILFLGFPLMVIVGAGVYNPQEKQTFMVEMDDGVKLATDLYFAPGSFGAPRSVILVRTPYGKNGMGDLYGLLYLTQDYHLVVQDSRGTHASEGGDKYILFSDAYRDGVDTIEWIRDQPWSNGKVASVGASALGINEYFYAGMDPEGLLTQSIMISTPDLYKTSIYQGGSLRESMVNGWIEGTSPENYEYQVNQIISHPLKDNFYNSTSMFMDIGPTFEQVSVKALHIGGWYDPFQQGTLDGYIGYDDYGQSEVRGKQLLIMTPSTHGFPREGKQGELTFPTKSVSGNNLYLNWEQELFDHVLLGKNFDWEGNRVVYYMMGDVDDENVDANDYRYAKDWPVPYQNDTWYLSSDESLLNNTLPNSNKKFTYLFDPTSPVPTIGGTNLLISSGPYDQSSIEDRSDVLIWESPTLTEPYEVVGHMWAHLYVASNCPNTDFTVKITDVYPDGRSILISDGIINAARRNGFNTTAPALNSVAYDEVDIDLWSTAYQFNTGHKIRIAISSSNYPRFGINPNTGETPKAHSYEYLTMNIANNAILTGPAYPSYIILPRPI